MNLNLPSKLTRIGTKTRGKSRFGQNQSTPDRVTRVAKNRGFSIKLSPVCVFSCEKRTFNDPLLGVVKAWIEKIDGDQMERWINYIENFPGDEYPKHRNTGSP